jgi:hypothetical protein
MSNDSGDTNKRLDSRLEDLRALLTKAETDAEFRALLKRDPAAAIKAGFGLDWNPAIKLEIVEETADCRIVVLPYLTAEGHGELSDSDLDLVSAGFGETVMGATETQTLRPNKHTPT